MLGRRDRAVKVPVLGWRIEQEVKGVYSTSPLFDASRGSARRFIWDGKKEGFGEGKGRHGQRIHMCIGDSSLVTCITLFQP